MFFKGFMQTCNTATPIGYLENLSQSRANTHTHIHIHTHTHRERERERERHCIMLQDLVFYDDICIMYLR